MNNNRILKEWLDATGKKININKNNSQSIDEKVYIWDMYIDPFDKGTWTSAEKYRGKWDGIVFKSEFEAIKHGRIHLKELEEDGELRGTPDDYVVDAEAIPKAEVSTDTLQSSAL